MIDENPPVRVIFRWWQKSVIALMPDEPADYAGRFCNSYQHIGQHGGANYYGIIHHSRAATSGEYMPLYRELKQIGYNLLVRKRWIRRRHS